MRSVHFRLDYVTRALCAAVTTSRREVCLVTTGFAIDPDPLAVDAIAGLTARF